MKIFSEKTYIIDDELTYLLRGGPSNYTPDKDKEGLYLVHINRPGLDKKDAVWYSYLSYHPAFRYVLVSYLLGHINTSQKEVGRHVINDRKSMLCLIDDLLTFDINFFDFKDSMDVDVYKTVPMSYRDLFKFLFQFKYTGNINELANLVDIAIKRNYYKFLKEVCGSIDSKYLQMSINDLNYKPYKDVNLLKSSLFLVEDLSSFIKSINDLGYNCSAGAQKQRGQINYGDNALSMVDLEFRTSLCCHYDHHYQAKNTNVKIPIKNFSFEYIHKNINRVTW